MGGWKPRGAGAGPQADPAPSTATVKRRRRRAEAEKAETPNVVAMREAMPRQAPGARPPAGKAHAPNRQSMKIRLGDRWSRIVREVKAGEYTWAEFVDGLDEEELSRCQLRADDGSFQGRPPNFVPREFLLAAQRELKRRFETLFSERVLAVAQQYLDMAQRGDLKDETRAKMLQYAMERVFGGIPKDVRIAQEQPWEQLVVNVQADSGDMPEHLARRYAGYAERQATD